MKVILLSDIAKIGKRHDIKEVSSGHALNFLFPKNLAVAATPEAMKRLEKTKATVEGEKKVQQDLLAKNIAELDGLEIFIHEKINAKGHLFAGLHREEIAKILTSEKKISIDPAAIVLDQPIKEAGSHQIEVRSGSISAKFTLKIDKK